jgi:hypothetical protein
MAQIKYQVTLSTDGAHSVSVASDDPNEMNEALAWARGIYLKLQAHATKRTDKDHAQDQAEHDTDEPPICAVHDVPMVRVQGKLGEFWSCHQKNEDGSWCSYKPPKR